MKKGLESILAAIESEPNPKLIDRYLALIADIEDDEIKTSCALKLARVLVTKQVDQAMRIAHMVFKSDRQNLEALDIVIDSLKAKGRFGKAEVLKNERNKLKSHFANSTSDKPPLGVAERLFDSDMSRPQSIDLRESSAYSEDDSDVGLAFAADQDRHGQSQLPRGVVAQSVAPDGERSHDVAPRGRESMPIHQDIFGPGATQIGSPVKDLQDTQNFDALFGADEGPAQSPEDAVDQLFEEPVAQPRNVQSPPKNGPSLSLDVPDITSRAKPRLESPPDVATSDLGVAVEMFDYYWQQGFVNEARDLLAQTAPVAGLEPWWKARNALVQKARVFVAKKAAVKETPARSPAAMDFWQALHEELGELSRRLSGREWVRKDQVASLFLGDSLPADAWEALLRLLRQKEGESPEELLGRRWEIISGIWGEEPRPDCAHLLETLGLARATPGFWGLYLDAILVAGRARKCLVEVREFLPQRPRLVWCNVAYPRVQLAWKRLRFRGAFWCEDDGVWPLLKRLSERPSPSLASAIVMGKDSPSDDID